MRNKTVLALLPSLLSVTAIAFGTFGVLTSLHAAPTMSPVAVQSLSRLLLFYGAAAALSALLVVFSLAGALRDTQIGATGAQQPTDKTSSGADERYRAFLQNSAAAIWRVELRAPLAIHQSPDQILEQVYAEGNAALAECNDAMARRRQVASPDDLVGTPLCKLLDPEKPEMRAFIASGYRLLDTESCETDAQGNAHYYLTNLIGSVEDDHLVRIWATQRDITEQKIMLSALQQSETRLRSFVENLPVLLLATDPSGVLTFVQGKGLEALQMQPEQALGQSLFTLFLENPTLTMPLQKALQGQGGTWTSEINGVFFEFHPTLTRDNDNNLTGLVMVALDVTARVAADEKLAWQEYHDNLTGLPNRLLLHDRLEMTLARIHRQNGAAALLLLDIDRFKQINDSLGHTCGDILLKEIAHRLKSAVREEDTVATLGADEFGVLLADLDGSTDVAMQVAEKLRRIIAQPLVLFGHEIVVSASVGIGVCPLDGADTATLFHHTDVALQRAKERGRDRCEAFDSKMTESGLERLVLTGDLRKALERGQMELHYQPQVSLSAHQLHGAEALLRWRHPERGMISPAKFIPIAEENGMILPIGEWVLREACRQAALWNEKGQPLRVSVNLSARQFRQGDLTALVTQVLRETRLDPIWLDIELTESTIIENGDEAATHLRRLKDLGVRISIDDFGTGYSSLSYLSRFPLDVLKIDRSFIVGMEESHEKRVVVQTLINMAHALKLEAIAEGVETVEQEQHLMEMGCDLLQGYLFSPPVPAGKMERLLLEESPAPPLKLNG